MHAVYVPSRDIPQSSRRGRTWVRQQVSTALKDHFYDFSGIELVRGIEPDAGPLSLKSFPHVHQIPPQHSSTSGLPPMAGQRTSPNSCGRYSITLMCTASAVPRSARPLAFRPVWLLLFNGRKALSLPIMPLVAFLGPFRLSEGRHQLARFCASCNEGAKNGSRVLCVCSHAREIPMGTRSRSARGAVLARGMAKVLRHVDSRGVSHGAHFVANSAFVQERVQRTWGVDCEVIHPPVRVAAIQRGEWRSQLTAGELQILRSIPERFVLGASRLVSYKRVGRAIDVGNDLSLPVVIAGSGPELASLRQQAADSVVPVTFVDAPTTPMLYALYEQAALFVFAAIEDFGIMPLGDGGRDPGPGRPGGWCP